MPTEVLRRYHDQVARGLETASGRRAVICGLARDLEPTLPLTLHRLQALGDLFADYRIVIYENDSTDGSLQILKEHAQRDSRFHVLSDSLGDPANRSIRCLDRVDRMARYRNRYREYISDQYSDFDVAIIADMDLPGGWDLDGIAHTFGYEGWDFVGSNGLIRKRYLTGQRLLQYDAWAFRKFGSYEELPTREVNYLQWNQDSGLIPVYSCFGGLGIYRMEAMTECSYTGGDCEHVALHREMREKGMTGQFLNPYQTTDYGIRYSKLLRWGQKSGLVSRLMTQCFS